MNARLKIAATLGVIALATAFLWWFSPRRADARSIEPMLAAIRKLALESAETGDFFTTGIRNDYFSGLGMEQAFVRADGYERIAVLYFVTQSADKRRTYDQGLHKILPREEYEKLKMLRVKYHYQHLLE